jgi:hypothetical protein
VNPTIRLELPVVGAGHDVARRFAGDPATWLPEPGRWAGDRAWTVSLRAGPAARTVACHVGSCWRDGDESWRHLAWRPVQEAGDPIPVDRLLPEFSGSIGLRVRAGITVLIVEGEYRPPAGRLGQVVDRLALHRVAGATAARFLHGVVGRLEVPEQVGARPR